MSEFGHLISALVGSNSFPNRARAFFSGLHTRDMRRVALCLRPSLLVHIGSAVSAADTIRISWYFATRF